MRFIGCIWVVMMAGPAAGLPALPDAAQVQLDTAADGALPDEPAWTGLLISVAGWDRNEAARGYVPGATAADMAAIAADPQAFRGELFVVEGRYAGRQRVMETLRAGPWGESLIEWGLVLPGGEVVMVYLVDPGSEVMPPREGATVRLAARFYKLWTDVDAQGVERTYPVFVGRAASVVDAPAAAWSGGFAVSVGVGVLVVGLGFVVVLRGRALAKATRRDAVQARLRAEAGCYEDDIDDEETSLPDDPAAALDALHGRGEQSNFK